jgi:hypothetical protein
MEYCPRLLWSGHAKVIGASIPTHGGDSKYLVIDDDDVIPDKHVRKGVGGLITVTFEMLTEDGQYTDPETLDKARITIEYLPKAISHQVMHIAIADINQEQNGSEVPALLARDVALGGSAASSYRTVDSVDLGRWTLNASQESAVRASLSQPVSLVHGPAGTGKTSTASALMGTFAERNSSRRRAVLFCAPTNAAVDNALRCMSKLSEGVRLLRIYSAEIERSDFAMPRQGRSAPSQSSAKYKVDTTLKKFALHWRCHALGGDSDPSKEASETRQIRKRLQSMDQKDGEFDKLRDEYLKAYAAARAVEVQQADIIFTTCASVRRNALLEALWRDGAPQISQVILDEAAQCVEPEALCPMAFARNAEHIIMFGDHCQLRPVVSSSASAAAGMDISLFERLATSRSDTRFPVILLNEQYRMHPSISRFPGMHFYGGLVRDAVSTEEMQLGILTHTKGGNMENAAMLFWDTCGDGGSDHRQSVRTDGSGGVASRSNLVEAKAAVSLAVKIAEEAGNFTVAVLSWYNSQVALIKKLLAETDRNDVHVSTISSAQGSEWKYVILSTVHTGGSDKGLGILSDPHLLNVALTRSISGLVIMGHRSALRGNEHWGLLLKDCEQHESVTTEAPGVRLLRGLDHDKVPRSKHKSKVLLDCRKRLQEALPEDAPLASSRRLSDANFMKQKQHSVKLASYGKSDHSQSRGFQTSSSKQSVIVVAHKGVSFGAQKKERSWRLQMTNESSESESSLPNRRKLVDRSPFKKRRRQAAQRSSSDSQ